MTAISKSAPDSILGMTATWLSMACAVHCVLDPIVLPLLPLAGIVLPVSRSVEMTLIGASILLALWNFYRGYRAHGDARLFGILPAAMLLIGSGLAAGHRESLHHAWEAVLVATGTLLLATGQFWNRRLHRNCTKCCEGHSH